MSRPAMVTTRSVRRRMGVLAALLSCGGILPAAAEYRLAAGDTLEMAVAGMPDLRQRAAIQLDGTVSIPAVGTIRAAGSKPSEVQAVIEGILTSRVLRQRGEGRERQVLLQPGDVAVTVAEYRPVVVGGDVQAPGQYPFRPTMTVRHALALAGGVSLLRGRANSAGIDAVEFERERKSILLEYARETARLWRLGAELQGSEEIRDRPLGTVPVPQAVLAEFVQIETRSLRIALANLAKERAYLTNAVQQADEQIASLTKQEQEERRGVEADTEELDRVTKLLNSGSVVNQRVTENRRAVLLSSTRRLQTSTRLAEVQRMRGEFAWRLAKLDSQHELDVLRDVREARARLAELSSRLDGTALKLALLGRMRVKARAGVGATTDLTIVRRTDAEWTRITAGEETELLPGDAIEVEFRQDQGPGAVVATR
ncbi:MAG: polysaccharide export protein [Methylobacterium frigidaeris]